MVRVSGLAVDVIMLGPPFCPGQAFAPCSRYRVKLSCCRSAPRCAISDLPTCPRRLPPPRHSPVQRRTEDRKSDEWGKRVQERVYIVASRIPIKKKKNK